MSDDWTPDLTPYLKALSEVAADFAAEEGIPQRFWAPLVIETTNNEGDKS